MISPMVPAIPPVANGTHQPDQSEVSMPERPCATVWSTKKTTEPVMTPALLSGARLLLPSPFGPELRGLLIGRV